uniref:Uncharacterized protein n=1 Tax=Vibrio tasmaniensis TaxID=212663 RepID=A0A0H3ZNZ1_9VIBR|nr:hypothetical protein [Vibrio tasmaniensis]
MRELIESIDVFPYGMQNTADSKAERWLKVSGSVKPCIERLSLM